MWDQLHLFACLLVLIGHKIGCHYKLTNSVYAAEEVSLPAYTPLSGLFVGFFRLRTESGWGWERWCTPLQIVLGWR
jgi:hypothetical protein